MKKYVKVKWIVKVPDGAEVHVKEKQTLKKGDLIVSINQEELVSFDASSLFSKLSKDKIDVFDNKWKDKEVSEGQLLFQTGGLFVKKILSPCNGKFKRVDEFNNIYISVGNGQNREIRCPINAKVTKIEDSKIIIVFKAIKFIGKGLIEGKTWGESNLEEVTRIVDLNSNLKGKIVISSQIDRSFVAKAEVVGVKALVTSMKDEDFDKIDNALPILMLSDKEWQKFLSKRNGEEKDLLLNSKIGKLLMVVE